MNHFANFYLENRKAWYGKTTIKKETLQLSVINYINRYKLNEADSLKLIHDINSIGKN